MKKILFFLTLFISFAATKSFSQNGGARMQQMQQQWQSYLKDSVKLSDAMTDSVSSIRMQYAPQMRQLYMDQNASPADKQTKLQAMRTEIESRYKAAGLTDDQIATIRKHEDNMRAQMMSKRNSGGGGR